MTTATNNDLTVTHCPKRNHIKPCWCGGRVKCYVTTQKGKRCNRLVLGESLVCWQHALGITTEDDE